MWKKGKKYKIYFEKLPKFPKLIINFHFEKRFLNAKAIMVRESSEAVL